MIPLFKIRFTYLARRPCSLIFGYILIPSLTILYFLPISIKEGMNRKKWSSFSQDIQFANSLYKSDTRSFEDFISNNLKNSAILTKIEDNGKKLSQFIEKETNIKINYFTEEDELNKKNYTNIIIYNQKNGRNEFQLKYIDKCNNSFSDLKSIYRCFKSQFSLRISGAKSKFESFLTKLISSEKKDIFLDAILLYYRDVDELIASIIGLYFSFEMALFSFYFTDRMIEEKEKKLHDFLERQGISKKKYIMSWFVTYAILSILPFVSFLSLCGV
jgi:hypothetical protein